jgi:hypothetical protein
MRHRRWVSTPLHLRLQAAVTIVVPLWLMLEDNEFKERDRRTTIAYKNDHKGNQVMQNYGRLTKSETFLRNHFK